MMVSKEQKVFLALVKAGLWEEDVQLSSYGEIDFKKVHQLAEEQSAVGLVAAGMEHVTDTRIPKDVVLSFVGQTLQLEQRNKETNEFLSLLIAKLNKRKSQALLVKGQGVAQSYARPLWRAVGDIDLLLDDENYERAKAILVPKAYKVEKEDLVKKHLGLDIMGVVVELHGRMPFAMSERVDWVIDSVIENSFEENGYEVWHIKDAEVLMPNPDNHVFLVFTHFLHHFFIEGVGLRQVCDWCRMLWTHKDTLNYELLKSRLEDAGLMTEWKAFAALAVDYLGMPAEAMPMYDARFRVKGKKVLKLVLKVGNFGHNKDLSYRTRYKGVAYKAVSLWRRFVDFVKLVPVFPLDTPRFFVTYVTGKVK